MSFVIYQVLLYATALREVVDKHGLSAKSNGTLLVDHMWDRTISGVSGNVSINDNGDRSADYALLDMDPKTGVFEVTKSVFEFWVAMRLT